VTAGSEVTIAGRVFRLGAIYAPRPGTVAHGRHALRRLLEHTTDSLLPGGRIAAAMVPSDKPRVMTGEEWAAWAGEEVAE
jgi:hypothetical protein